MKNIISEFLEEDVKNLHEDKTLNLTNMFTQIKEVNGIYFAYLIPSTKLPFIFYRILTPLHYYHIQKLLEFKDKINKKGTKQYNKYHWNGKEYEKGNAERIKLWYAQMHNNIFRGVYN